MTFELLDIEVVCDRMPGVVTGVVAEVENPPNELPDMFLLGPEKWLEHVGLEPTTIFPLKSLMGVWFADDREALDDLLIGPDRFEKAREV